MDINALTKQIIEFRNERNWQQFHKPKDMALSLVLESTELLEHFQWKSEPEADTHVSQESKALGEELADVLYWTLLMAHDFGIDLSQAFARKMVINKEKYPVDKFKGSNRKYDDAWLFFCARITSSPWWKLISPIFSAYLFGATDPLSDWSVSFSP